jgi:phospholipid/cholesterol/gamma-HCH transport system substrate-binding protein
MEIRARFLLIGLFALASILAGFVFVYWMETAGGLGQRARYQINFDSSVSGLLSGSIVLFNGVRVGEVTKLALDPSRPRGVTVGIAIEAQTPVRADTKVGIEFQGLTGAPVVSLTGGSATLPLLAATGGRPPELTAESNAGQALSQTAREVLRNIDKVVLENTDPLRQLISNIDKFSGALARNSDRVDGIVGRAHRSPRAYRGRSRWGGVRRTAGRAGRRDADVRAGGPLRRGGRAVRRCDGGARDLARAHRPVL